MKSILQNRLARLDGRHLRAPNTKRLKVYYGWVRLNKIRKKEAISVIFENDDLPDVKTERFIKKMMDVVYVRYQTTNEKAGVENAIRSYTEYSVFLSDKRFQGSLNLALKYNCDADKNNVSQKEREIIMQKLRAHYLNAHPKYKEPIVQRELEF